MKANVGIVDYGLGNLRSVAGAIERLDHRPVVSADAGELAQADCLILPGVGAFGDGMKNLGERKLIGPLTEMVLGGKPLLGICLGFQLIASCSEEFGEHEGLGWIPGSVVRLAPAEPRERIPHVGWDDLDQAKASALFANVPDDALFYYVHSYRLVPEDEAMVIGCCDYGGSFVAAVAHGNICGVQFHPEKSQRHGLTVLDNFVSGVVGHA